MKRTLQTTKAFDKDLKRAKKRGKNINKLREIIDTLAAGQTLAARFRPHMLSGKWSEFWECHVEPDWLLVWIYKDEKTVVLFRLGTHADLFG